MNKETGQQKIKYDQGSLDAQSGYPANRFMQEDPNYMNGYNDIRNLIDTINYKKAKE